MKNCDDVQGDPERNCDSLPTGYNTTNNNPASKPDSAESADLCLGVFDRVAINKLQRGCNRIFWELADDFKDPPPYFFHVQYAHAPSAVDSDWKTIGDGIWNRFFFDDSEQRNFGKVDRTYYRVVLATEFGLYYSDPVGAEGVLSNRDWKQARGLIRRKLKEYKRGMTAVPGVLLKRRIYEQKCSRCLDSATGLVTDPNCPHCWGTGDQCGYYYPIECVWADLSPMTYRYHRDSQQARGGIKDIVQQAEMLNTWLLGEDDIWVDTKKDRRYYIHKVSNKIEVRGVPILADVELRLASAVDVAHDIPVPQVNPTQTGQPGIALDPNYQLDGEGNPQYDPWEGPGGETNELRFGTIHT